MSDTIERLSLKHYEDNLSMEGMDHTTQLMMQGILVNKRGSDIANETMMSLIEAITAEAKKSIDSLRGWRSFLFAGAGGVFSLVAGVHGVPGVNKNPLTGRLFGYTAGMGNNPKRLMEISRSSSQAFSSAAQATGSGKSIIDSRVQAIQIETKVNQDRLETFKSETMNNKKRKDEDKDTLMRMIDQERGNKGQTIQAVTRA